MLLTTAFAQTAGAASGDSTDFQSLLLNFAPLVLIVAVFYFMLFRPQQQRASELQKQLAGLRRGDRIVTAGGLIATVARVVSDEELELEIATGVRVRAVRSTITTVLAKTGAVTPDKPTAEKSGDDTTDGGAAPTDDAGKRRRPSSGK